MSEEIGDSGGMLTCSDWSAEILDVLPRNRMSASVSLLIRNPSVPIEPTRGYECVAIQEYGGSPMEFTALMAHYAPRGAVAEVGFVLDSEPITIDGVRQSDLRPLVRAAIIKKLPHAPRSREWWSEPG